MPASAASSGLPPGPTTGRQCSRHREIRSTRAPNSTEPLATATRHEQYRSKGCRTFTPRLALTAARIDHTLSLYNWEFRRQRALTCGSPADPQHSAQIFKIRGIPTAPHPCGATSAIWRNMAEALVRSHRRLNTFVSWRMPRCNTSAFLRRSSRPSRGQPACQLHASGSLAGCTRRRGPGRQVGQALAVQEPNNATSCATWAICPCSSPGSSPRASIAASSTWTITSSLTNTHASLARRDGLFGDVFDELSGQVRSLRGRLWRCREHSAMTSNADSLAV